MPVSPPTLLIIPPEIRQHIYSYLIPESSTSHPLLGIGLTSVSHHPPATALLNITPQLSDEILEYYYTVATWRLILSAHMDAFKTDRDLEGLERSVVLTRLRKVEITFSCASVLLSQTPAMPGQICGQLQEYVGEIQCRTFRACSVLLNARSLRAVTISWVDPRGHRFKSPRELPWLDECAVLEPLAKLLILRQPIAFYVGRVEGPPRDWFVGAVYRTLDPEGLAEQLESTAAEYEDIKSAQYPMTRLWVPALDSRPHLYPSY